MLGVGVVLGVDTAGALPTSAGGGKARGMHEVKLRPKSRANGGKSADWWTAIRGCEPVPIFHVAFSSREMLVKRKILFLLIA